jgi:16S rRNA processing protein RimM
MTDSGSATNHHYTASCGELTPKRIKVSERLVPLGEIVATHGIEGWLRLRLYNPESRTLSPNREILLEKAGLTTPQRLKAVKGHSLRLSILLDGVAGIDEAKKWIGATLSITEAGLPPLAPNEYYYYQAVGLEVFDINGARIGVVERIWPKPGGDLYVVKGETKEYLIPIVKEIIEKIDLAARRIIINPPAGLLEL